MSKDWSVRTQRKSIFWPSLHLKDIPKAREKDKEDTRNPKEKAKLVTLAFFDIIIRCRVSLPVCSLYTGAVSSMLGQETKPSK